MVIEATKLLAGVIAVTASVLTGCDSTTSATAPATTVASSPTQSTGLLSLWTGTTDPAQTALSFTQDYLGYRSIDTVDGVRESGDECHVTVGYANPAGRVSTSAVLHLIRSGAGAPWTVVGTEDSTLSLTAPAYGSTVRSPVQVGGVITGVDESLDVRIRIAGEQATIGETGMIPAGGENTPWRADVTFDAPPGRVLTIAVSTGGHVVDVERFAITGART